MKRSRGFPRVSMFLALFLALAMVSVVFATVITVDGDPSDWPGANDCTIMADGCPRVANDPYDVEYQSTNYPEWDVENVYVTNDTSNLYWRMDTYSDTQLSGSAFVYICMDTDQDTSTGGEVSQCDGTPATNMLGVDYVLELRQSGPTHTAYLYQCSNGDTSFADCSYSSAGAAAVMTNTVEASVSLSDIGVDTNRAISIGTYFDNADNPTDDNIPDAGQIAVLIGEGSPTAITLSAIDAGPALAGLPAFAMVIAAVVGGAGLFIWKRRA